MRYSLLLRSLYRNERFKRLSTKIKSSDTSVFENGDELIKIMKNNGEEISVSPASTFLYSELVSVEATAVRVHSVYSGQRVTTGRNIV